MKRQSRINFLFMMVLIAILAPAVATAIPVKYTTVNPGLAVHVNLQGNDHYVYTGVYNLEVGSDTSPVGSFCIDFFQNAPTSTANDYSFANLGDVFSETAATSINLLWTGYFMGGMTDIEAASLQLALWEIATEDILDNTTTAYDLTAGAFSSFPSANGNNGDAAIGGAITMLNSLGNLTETSNLVALTSPTKQDFLVSAPVPEPTTMLLLGSGLLGTALYRRKKRIKKT